VRAATALAALLLAASPAVARMHAGPSQLHAGHRLQGAIAPLDGGGAFASPAAAYSLRKLKSAYAGPGIKLRRASDSATQDINFLGFTGFSGALLDVAAAATFCNATTCFGDTWYDQSGTARHMVQATAANQYQYVANCGTGLPCLRATAVTQGMASAGTLTPATGVVSFSAVANRSVGLGYCTWLRENTVANRFSGDAVAGQWRLDGGTSGSILAAAADNAWHSAQAVMNGAGSSIMVDGTTTTGTVTGNTVAGFVQITGDTASTCGLAESVVWDNYALSLAERQALTNNQRAFWGF